MSKTQEELLERAVGGDSDALGELLTFHGPALRGSLVGEIGQQWQATLDADDIMQVTYLEAFLRIHKFQPHGIASFVAWLKQIAVRNMQDAIKGLSRVKRPDPHHQIRAPVGVDSVWDVFDVVGGHSSTPSRVAGRQERNSLLDECLKRLPPDYEMVVRLYDLNEKDIADIAKQMNRTIGAIYMLRARALERIRELLPEISALFSSVR